MTVRIFVAGHRGMVGSAIVRKLSQNPDVALLLASRSELNLKDAAAVQAYMQRHKPDQVYLAAAKVAVFMPTTHTLRILLLIIW